MGLALVTLTASQSGGVENDSWQFTYLYTAERRSVCRHLP